MFIKSLLRLHSHRRFDYQPRYYDEVKEKRLERQSKKISFESDSKRISFREGWRKESKLHSTSGTSLRVAIIFGILVLISYLFLRSLSIKLF